MRSIWAWMRSSAELIRYATACKLQPYDNKSIGR
jgi:hypothetical protein